MRHNPLYIDLYEKSTGKQVHPKQVDNALRDALGHLGYPYDNDSWYLDWMTELSIKGADAASHLRGQSTGTLLIDVKGNGYYKNLDPTQAMTSEEKEAYDAYSQYYNDKADALDWVTDHYSLNSAHAPRNNPRKKPVPSRGRKPARDNATFTGEPLIYDTPDQMTVLVSEFYRAIDERIPGNTPVPIPPPESIHPRHLLHTQSYIFADYAVRRFAPIQLEAAKFSHEAEVLRNLPKIVNENTLNKAMDTATNAQEHIYSQHTKPYWDDSYTTIDDARAALASVDVHGATVNRVARHAGIVASSAAMYDPQETWKAVKEMLKSL